MSKQNKNYVLYELRKRYLFERSDKDYIWYYCKYTRSELVTRCARTLNYDYSILDNLSKNMSETFLEVKWKSEYHYDYIPKYFIARVDKNFNLYKVNLDALRKDAERRAKEGFAYHYYWRARSESTKTYHPEFRKDPIIGCGSRNHVGGASGCTHSGLKKYVEQNTDPEYKEYCKTKYNHSYKLERWDWDWYRGCGGNHNWKRQYKVKHQWEIHKGKHKDTIKYSDKRNITLREELETLSELY